ncbi:DUF362 domain-containing protein [Candidatus Pacearchaeota archaeon]|nr:DUF362 domain-containing protein [Candidatus Pacearchaeota archaeon]
MAKGAAIKLISFQESVPKLLELLRLGDEIKKYDKIILKPFLSNSENDSTPVEFTEAVLKFCIENKNPVADVLIAEGAEEDNTLELFDERGYQRLAEKYGIGLIDLNSTETETIENPEFLKFSTIEFPRILSESFLISLPKIAKNEETILTASLSNMLGAFPYSSYSGFFSKGKNKIRKWSIKYSIHDISKCKIPDFAILDASSNSQILAGLPLEMDKQAAKILGMDWKEVPYIKLLNQSMAET